MIHLQEGFRVRHIHTAQTGTVVDVVKGNVADAVHVQWDDPQMDSRWNRHRRTWEPSSHLEGTDR